MNAFKHRPAHAKNFEDPTSGNMRWAGGGLHQFQRLDRNPAIDGTDDLSKTLSALGDKLDPVRAIPEPVSLLLHFLNLAI